MHKKRTTFQNHKIKLHINISAIRSVLLFDQLLEHIDKRICDICYDLFQVPGFFLVRFIVEPNLNA